MMKQCPECGGPMEGEPCDELDISFGLLAFTPVEVWTCVTCDLAIIDCDAVLDNERFLNRLRSCA